MNELLEKHWWRHNLYVSAIKLLPLSKKHLSRKFDVLILSTGRTGTTWMSEILSLVDGIYVVHEPIPVEAYAHRDAVHSEIKAKNYIMRVKRKDIFVRSFWKGCGVYGEVNGNLRRHAPLLKECFPEAKLLHLVRDGKKVVRSVLARGTFKRKHPIFGNECPIPLEGLSREWRVMSDFEKACRVWKEENEFLRKHVSHLARLEDITSGYDAFQAQVLEPLDLYLSEPVWKKYAGRKVNESKNNRMRLDEEWTAEQENIFQSICGGEMKALGYF